ncbi:MAG: hypothetical protein BWY17_01567 [Deltaproteobacteria bacterium ADurb.Bin207]|nr:MAG: hypothetical protein BWY17_01567 [Deltaproteobacteria bacterium ADurb.Bin207]
MVCGGGCVASTVFAGDWEHSDDFELGYQGSYVFEARTLSRNRPYASAAHRTSVYSEESPTRWRLDASLRGWVDVRGDLENEVQPELDVRELSLSRADDYTDIRLGLQQIAWGETFGVPIADVVNPRDLRDPLFLEMDWVRRPTWTANVQVMVESLRLQAVATPLPRNNELPERGSAYDPFPPVLKGVEVEPQREFSLGRFGRDGEYGGRLGYLFDFGLDVGLLYFFHWNRVPVYELAMQGGRPVVVPFQDRIHTAGITVSMAFEDWVLRGDGVMHGNVPWMTRDLQGTRRIDYLQAIVGVDRTTESGWTLGAQFHIDYRGDRMLTWGSGRIQKSLWDGDLEPQIFAYIGVDNTDRWVQPRIDWHVLSLWTLSVRADLVWGTTGDRAGDLGFIDGRHRVMMWTSLRL